MYDAPYAARGVHWSDDSQDSPPPTVLKISPNVHHDIPHGTQDNPHDTHDIPHGTEHTLYRVNSNRKVKMRLYDTTLSTRCEKPTYMIKLCMQFRYLQI